MCGVSTLNTDDNKMKTKLLFTILIAIIGFTAYAQCRYIPSTSTAADTLSYSFSGGLFKAMAVPQSILPIGYHVMETQLQLPL